MLDFIDTVLIIGSGGREHAILKALLRSERPLCTFAYPGNPGMERDGCMIVEEGIGSWEDLAAWAENNEIGLTVVGPEIPLTEGIVDTFKEHGLLIFGPTKAAAQIEGSKEFAKNLMKKYKIPTADFKTFTNKKDALAHVEKTGAPIVIKASGLAAGKGVVICNTPAEAKKTLADIFDKKVFGKAGDTVIIEEMLTGAEASLFVLTDGKTYKILPVAQDHKRAFDGDKGPNTGGMGAYAPVSIIDAKTMAKIEKEIVAPTLAAMEKEKARFRGVLFIGLMLTNKGPKVIEYNCRFGDPEAQAILPLVRCDWYAAFKECASVRGKASNIKLAVDPGACATVVMASGGYPGKFAKGKVISGIDAAEKKGGVDVYFAGVCKGASKGRGKNKETAEYKTNGGRVLAISAKGKTLKDALKNAYAGVGAIKFDGAHYRKDIGKKG